ARKANTWPQPPRCTFRWTRRRDVPPASTRGSGPGWRSTRVRQQLEAIHLAGGGARQLRQCDEARGDLVAGEPRLQELAELALARGAGDVRDAHLSPLFVARRHHRSLAHPG